MEGQWLPVGEVSLDVMSGVPTLTSSDERNATTLAVEGARSDTPDPDAQPLPSPRLSWEGRLLRQLVVADATAGALAVAVTWWVRHSQTNENLALFGQPFPYLLVALLAIPGYLIALGLTQSYERSLLGSSPTEYSRVARAVAGLFILISMASFLGGVELSRAVVACFFSSLLLFGVLARRAVRRQLHRRRAVGQDLRHLVLVGRSPSVLNLTSHLRRSVDAGYEVVGAYIPGVLHDPIDFELDGVPILGEPDSLLGDLADLRIDAIALSGAELFEHESVRSLAWKLHGTGVQLLMAPDLAEIAGPRIVSRPAAGLPMLLVDEPRLNGWGQLVKAVGERVGALIGLLALSPLLAFLALRVWRSGPGPILYRQTRVARSGKHFSMLKFRTMVQGAELMVSELVTENEHDGVLFKIREDPRITSVGRFLRRYSLDELPQLINVVRGEMAIVGPRPPLPSEVAQYGGDMARRLMVKPGITGLWQVNGRSDLSWEETVRLDLYYVENWSMWLDAVILAKTARAVLGGSGAY